MAIVTVLDDYQDVALTSTDWSPVLAAHVVEVDTEHLIDVAPRLADSAIVVAMRERTVFDAALFARLPALELLVTTGMKNASIDLDAAAAHGVTVCGTEGIGNAVPELTIGMMIALTRNFAQEDAAVRAGGWQHTIGPGLAGRTLGVVGLGRLGIPVARLAQAFGMEVIAWSPQLTQERAEPHGVRCVSKAELFGTADVITIHMPLSERSRGLIGAAELGAMKRSAYLINTSRGPIVDEAALLGVLGDGLIAGAGLDVYDVEPLPVHHRLRDMPNTLLLPHIGYVTTEVYEFWYAQVVEDIMAWTAGAPVRVLSSPG
ncbi:D-2-hydroxyacid dehydrogenase family protein [Jatrophihabitans sp.]|uniref:D-2-hydroxyacid dehydrogenase family protein n=1 Tax=Jatrophihabitans sp. TaxID=1932789 RepID=UPI0030C67FF0|nr:Phosphoglycerate dehydrogenase [Jatrophihabitans sp.]